MAWVNSRLTLARYISQQVFRWLAHLPDIVRQLKQHGTEAKLDVFEQKCQALANDPEQLAWFILDILHYGHWIVPKLASFDHSPDLTTLDGIRISAQQLLTELRLLTKDSETEEVVSFQLCIATNWQYQQSERSVAIPIGLTKSLYRYATPKEANLLSQFYNRPQRSPYHSGNLDQLRNVPSMPQVASSMLQVTPSDIANNRFALLARGSRIADNELAHLTTISLSSSS